MRRYHNIVFVFFLFIITCWLVSLAPQKKWSGKIELIDGVTYIRNPDKGIWDGDPLRKLVLKPLLTIGTAEGDASFFLVCDIATDRVGNIYASDMRDHCIKVFDAHGGYMRTIGHQGQGPGEFRQPENIAIGPNNDLFVFDRNRRVSIFSPDGEYKSSFKVFVTPTGFQINDRNEVILSPRSLYILKPAPMIYHYNLEGKQVKAYGESVLITEEEDESGLSRFASCYLDIASSGELVSAFEYPYLIRIYSPNGNLIKIITRNSTRFTEPKNVVGTSKSQYGTSQGKKRIMRSFITGVFWMPDGKFFTTVWDYGSDYQSKLTNFDTQNPPQHTMIIDLFDNEGRFLKSFEYDPLIYGTLKHVDEQGKIYFVYNSQESFPTVTKYSLEFSQH